MDSEEGKYTRVEYERRFLVSPQANWRGLVEPYSKTLEDKYLHDSRLRLRILTDSDTGRQLLKLNKKLCSDSPYFQTISRILLSPGEYRIFDGLKGDRLRKTRYYHNYLGRGEGGFDGVEWLVPWYSVADDPAQVAAMERELGRELSPGHPLYGLPVRTLGRRQDCDDVLFAVEDGTGRVAVVHLTWTHSPPEKPPWPGTVVYRSFESWVVEGMQADHDEFHA